MLEYEVTTRYLMWQYREKNENGFSLCIHKALVFFKQTTRHFRDHVWVSLEVLEIKFIPRIPYCSPHVWANGHSHRIWCAVLACWRQSSHCVSTLTRRWCSLSLVGRQFEHALQRNILTFSGTFRAQTSFQIGPSPRAAEFNNSLWKSIISFTFLPRMIMW